MPLARLAGSAVFARCLAKLWRVEWVIYAKRPFADPAAVLAYLSRYTHRVAIANSRLVTLTGGRVSFRWRDYRHHNKSKVMTLAADEFIRRFLLHAIPDGFHRIRHYGFLSNRRRAEKLVRCRTLLAVADVTAPLGDIRERRRLTDHAYDSCSCCGGRMEPIGSMAGLCAPLSTLREYPKEYQRMTRGPVWFAIPSLQETSTLYSLPVSPAH